MDLKSGTPLWPALSGQLAAYRPLERDIRCDVAIVGAGLTGALIGHCLARSGFEVVLLDKRNVARGSTSASTALILYEIDTPLVRLMRMIGRKAAVRAYQLCREAIFQIEEVVGRLPDDCGFARKRSLYLASRKADATGLRSEGTARQKAGFDVRYLAASELRDEFSLKAPAALLSADAAEIDPYRFAHALVTRAKGVRVYGETNVTHWESAAKRVSLYTAEKHKIVAQRVVVATGYESRLPFVKRLIKLRSTYALATAPVRDLAEVHRNCLIWETARPYFYFRTTPDSRIVLGGGDEDFQDPARRDRLISSKTRALEKKLKELFPSLRTETEYCWAGTFGDTRDGLPCIGTVRGQPRVSYAFCYGANGTNFAMIAANLITDWVRGRRNRDAGLFSLSR